MPEDSATQLAHAVSRALACSNASSFKAEWFADKAVRPACDTLVSMATTWVTSADVNRPCVTWPDRVGAKQTAVVQALLSIVSMSRARRVVLARIADAVVSRTKDATITCCFLQVISEMASIAAATRRQRMATTFDAAVTATTRATAAELVARSAVAEAKRRLRQLQTALTRVHRQPAGTRVNVHRVIQLHARTRKAVACALATDAEKSAAAAMRARSRTSLRDRSRPSKKVQSLRKAIADYGARNQARRAQAVADRRMDRRTRRTD